MSEEELIIIIRSAYLLFVFCLMLYLLCRGFIAGKRISSSEGMRPSALQMGHEKRLQMFQMLKPVVFAAEKYRKKCIRNFRISSLVIAAVSLYAAQVVISLPTADSMFIVSVISGVLILFALALAEQRALRLFKNYFKNTVTPIIANAADCIYYPSGGKALSDLQKAEKIYDKDLIPTLFNMKFSVLFGFFSRIEQEDGFVFRNNGKPISFEEIYVVINDIEGDQLAFKGLLSAFETEKNVSSPILIAESSRNHILNDMKNIKLEDTEFSKKFKVYCSDEIEVRKVLTPRFMEKIKNISLYCDDSPVAVLFIGNMLFSAVKITKDLFEPEPVFSEIKTMQTADSIINMALDNFRGDFFVTKTIIAHKG